MYHLSISNQVELPAGATPKLAAADEGTKPLCAILFDLFIVHIKWLYFLHYSNLITVYLLHVFNPGNPNISIDCKNDSD